MKKNRVIAAFMLAIFLLQLLPFTTAHADNTQNITISETYINPLYSHLVFEEQLVDITAVSLFSARNAQYATEISQAGSVLRQQLKERAEIATVYYVTDGYDGNQDTVRKLMQDIAQQALIHTGEPTEGDYLLWQFGGWKANASGSVSEDKYYWTITYTFTYYTSAEEEAILSDTVNSILNGLDLNNLTEYQKIQKIYDYICSHVTYDYDHRNDPDYKHQFTAYAALVHGTSVCQGYALALYRLALTAGLDCRLIPGKSGGEDHGWNIVKLGNLYYNLDSTWDSKLDNYQYFLKSPTNFRSHLRDADYDNGSFHISYPMSPLDYVPNVQDLCDHSFTEVTVSPTCVTPGITESKCEHCGFISFSLETEPFGHSWDAGTLVLPPTETADGETEYRCAVCQATRTEIIPEQDNFYRVSGENRYETAFKTADLLKQQLLVDKFSCIVVASGSGFADALSGSCLAIRNQAPILLVNRFHVEAVADYVFENAVPGCPVYILGGEAAVPTELDELLSESFNIKRLAGENRYETNLLILRECGIQNEALLICTGQDYADSLSVSALNRPVLLIKQALTDSQKQYLLEAVPSALYIIGGTNAVNQETEQALSELTSLESVRISGDNRYETSIQVAGHFFPDAPKNIVLVYGRNFPDGLCGGVLAHSLQSPLLLTRAQNVSLAAAYANTNSLTTGAVLGGTSLISDETLQQILPEETEINLQ